MRKVKSLKALATQGLNIYDGMEKSRAGDGVKIPLVNIALRNQKLEDPTFKELITLLNDEGSNDTHIAEAILRIKLEQVPGEKLKSIIAVLAECATIYTQQHAAKESHFKSAFDTIQKHRQEAAKAAVATNGNGSIPNFALTFKRFANNAVEYVENTKTQLQAKANAAEEKQSIAEQSANKSNDIIVLTREEAEDIKQKFARLHQALNESVEREHAANAARTELAKKRIRELHDMRKAMIQRDQETYEIKADAHAKIESIIMQANDQIHALRNDMHRQKQVDAAAKMRAIDGARTIIRTQGARLREALIDNQHLEEHANTLQQELDEAQELIQRLAHRINAITSAPELDSSDEERPQTPYHSEAEQAEDQLDYNDPSEEIQSPRSPVASMMRFFDQGRAAAAAAQQAEVEEPAQDVRYSR